MVDASSDAHPIHPDASKLFPGRMKSFYGAAIVACTFAVACAPATTPPEVPQPTPVTAPPFHMDSTLTADKVPPFKESPLVVWGPLPDGVEHGERVRSYDLQHQSTTVRFDWTRHAVVGTTTLTIGALPGARALSDLVVDAGDMTVSRVTARGSPLRIDNDSHQLTIHLARPLRNEERISFTVEYEGVNRTKGAYFRPAKHIVWTQGETEDNRYWVPTYDFPNDKTTWEFYIWTAKDERALSNGRLAGSRAVGDSIEWHWVQDKPASTYLMTCVIGNYVVFKDKPWRNAPIGYWTYPDSVDAAWRGFAKTPQAVDVFSRKTAYAYRGPSMTRSSFRNFSTAGWRTSRPPRKTTPRFCIRRGQSHRPTPSTLCRTSSGTSGSGIWLPPKAGRISGSTKALPPSWKKSSTKKTSAQMKAHTTGSWHRSRLSRGIDARVGPSSGGSGRTIQSRSSSPATFIRKRHPCCKYSGTNSATQCSGKESIVT